jgi:hypothetical protein
MKKTLLIIGVVMLCMFSIASAQTFSDYVSAMRGDTAVIKDYTENANTASTLTNAVNSDTINVPAGRVYMLKTNGYYPLAANLTTPSTRSVVIIGQNFTRLVNNKDINSAPPLICGNSVQGGASNPGGINWQNNLTVKNCNIVVSAPDGNLNWSFFGTGSANKKVFLENCLFERTKWVIINSNSASGSSIFINDCYFVNLTGLACRRNGGVFDNVDNPTDTIWVENSTHIMAEGSMYKFRNFPVKKGFFNHNTFINCAGSTFESLGYLSNLVVTNNIFVNSNIQPFDTTLVNAGDLGETDADNLPTGLVNCRALPASMTQLDRKILVDNNLIYWDARLTKLDSVANARSINNDKNWMSQAITMNSRTQAMFNDNTTYPYLTEGRWFRKVPTFTDPKNLLTAATDSIRDFAIRTVDVTSTNILSDWRLVNIGKDYIVYSDWPIPVDLSYSDADLMAGGTGGFPVGDLNWFPAKKTQWLAQAVTEHTAIETALNSGHTTTGVDIANLPVKFQLQQNYPNPFNPSTKITFSLPHSADASLKVFDMLGREVATLVNGYTAAGSHEVQFNASNVSSGVYFYKLTSGSFTQIKKMMLVK